MDQHLLFFLVGQSIRVCYGRLGGNLPHPNVVVSLYKSKNINAMRLYDPYNVALQALKGSNIIFIVSNITFIVVVPNDNLQCFVFDASAANT